jgi:hypothetical protein
MVNPIHLLMAFFGYVKIPVEVIRLSMEQESFIQAFVNLYKDDPRGNKLFSPRLEYQKTITKFSRSGKIISG